MTTNDIEPQLYDEDDELDEGADLPDSSSGPSPSKRTRSVARLPKFQIKKIVALATWNWTNAADQCAICRNHLMELCIECQAHIENIKCNVAWGTCNHAFHEHCIGSWIKSRKVCPLDNREWKVDHVDTSDRR